MIREECTGLIGRMRDICNGSSGLPLHKTNQYRESRGLAPLTKIEFVESAKTIVRVPDPPPRTHRIAEPVGEAMKRRIESIVKVKTGRGCGCNTLANDMDSWGIDGCLLRREVIVEHLVSNKDLFRESLSQAGLASRAASVALSVLPDFVSDEVMRIGANKLLDMAISDVRAQIAEKAARRATARLSPRVRSSIVIPLSSEQVKLHRDAIQQKPSPDPFDSDPVVHFGAHLWPIQGRWKWHADRWIELASEISGKCVVGVAIDDSTSSFEEVREYFPERFELFSYKNQESGENATFARLRSVIPQGDNDVLVYCHGKGVRPHTYDSEAVRLWTEMMYEAVVFNWRSAISRMSEGYRTFGSFRTFGDMPLSPANRWHYSGTFFVVRSKYLSLGSLKTGYGGVECWPGDAFSAKHSYCEFMDGQPFKLGYDVSHMYPGVVDQQMGWEANRIGGPRCEQHLREMLWFFGHLRNSDRVLVIGSKHGGLEYQMKSRFPSMQIVSCDIDPQRDNFSEQMIIGSSHSHDVQCQMRDSGPFDAVFIDGDHSYAGVKEDWLFCQSLQPRLVGFHDIASAIKHRNEGCFVDQLWREIKSDGYSCDEKIVGCGWGGIGVVFL